jgi:hypothetical protein
LCPSTAYTSQSQVAPYNDLIAEIDMDALLRLLANEDTFTVIAVLYGAGLFALIWLCCGALRL